MQSIIHIRPIQPQDNQPLAAVIRGAFDDYEVPREGTVFSDPTTDRLYELFRQEGSMYFVAEENGVLLGGCGIYPTEALPEGCAELVKFYLAAAARGKGIGRQLLEQSIEAARQIGYNQLYLESFPEMSQAVSIYKKTGFTTLPAPLGNSGHYACNVWMLKEL